MDFWIGVRNGYICHRNGNTAETAGGMQIPVVPGLQYILDPSRGSRADVFTGSFLSAIVVLVLENTTSDEMCAIVVDVVNMIHYVHNSIYILGIHQNILLRLS